MYDDTPQLELEVKNPAEFLRYESGTFEAISPFGQAFRVTCRLGSRMSVRQVSEATSVANQQQMTWKIRRIDNATQ